MYGNNAVMVGDADIDDVVGSGTHWCDAEGVACAGDSLGMGLSPHT